MRESETPRNAGGMLFGEDLGSEALGARLWGQGFPLGDGKGKRWREEMRAFPLKKKGEEGLDEDRD